MNTILYKIVTEYYIDELYHKYENYTKNWAHECDYLYNMNDCEECKKHSDYKTKLIYEWIDNFNKYELHNNKYVTNKKIVTHIRKHPNEKIIKFTKIKVAEKIKELGFRLIAKTKKQSKSIHIKMIFDALHLYEKIYLEMDNDDHVYVLYYDNLIL